MSFLLGLGLSLRQELNGPAVKIITKMLPKYVVENRKCQWKITGQIRSTFKTLLRFQISRHLGMHVTPHENLASKPLLTGSGASRNGSSWTWLNLIIEHLCDRLIDWSGPQSAFNFKRGLGKTECIRGTYCSRDKNHCHVPLVLPFRLIDFQRKPWTHACNIACMDWLKVTVMSEVEMRVDVVVLEQ